MNARFLRFFLIGLLVCRASAQQNSETASDPTPPVAVEEPAAASPEAEKVTPGAAELLKPAQRTMAKPLPLPAPSVAGALDKPGGMISANGVTKPQLDGRVWGAVVFAAPDENHPLPGAEAEPSALYETILPRMRTAFPEFTRFALLGEHTGDIYREYESWLVPSRDFFFRLDSGGPLKDKDGLRVNLQVWRKKDVVFKTDVSLISGNALFVGGQNWRKGRILFVIALESGRPTSK